MLAGSAVTMIAGVPTTVVLVILLLPASTALNAIVIGTLYVYAANDKAPAHFDHGFLRQAFVQK